jgi:NAD(P)-dependent dehydrogenase (short-subunit alcohol dehydrogenase family)
MISDSLGLTGKVLLITGATGIAGATARVARDQGARVFVASLPGEGADYEGDVSEEQHAAAAVETCLERHDRLDALFNVAGMSGRRFGDGPIHECSAEGWDRTLQVNLRSMFLMCRAALQPMLRQGSGSIVNMTSVLAFSPEPKYFASHAYAASKGAAIALTTSMAAYYAPLKIRVNAVAPGLVETPMSRRAQENKEIFEFIRDKQPVTAAMLAPEQVARAALFLLSDAAASITGQILTVDGGWSVSS